MGVTLKQIADLAGVHKSTVDKVIHNRPGVSDAKRQQIKALLKEYEYESNPLAKALNYQKNKMTVAVVIPVVDALPFLKAGIEIVRQDFNSFNVEIAYYEMPFSDADGQAACLRRLAKDGVSGVLLLPIEAPVVAEAMAELEQAKIPVVTVNSDLDDAPHLCYVGQNMAQSGQVAARLFSLLLPAGGEVAILSSRNMRSIKQREQSFIHHLPACSAALSVEEAVNIRETEEDAYRETCILLDRYPNLRGLFITCGRVPDICRAIRDRGRTDLTIICYEKYPAIAELVRDGTIACTLSGDLEGQGRLAMRLLFEKLIYEREPEREIYYTSNEILLKENI